VFTYCLYLFSVSTSLDKCFRIGRPLPALCALVTWTTDSIFAVRCWAIWRKSKTMGICVGLMIATEIILMSIGLSQFSMLPPYDGVAGPCIPIYAPNPHWALFTWIPPLAFALTIFCLTTYKVLWYKRQSAQEASSSVLRIFWRDGVIYVMAVSFIYLLNAIFFLQKNENIQAANAMAAFLIPAMLCNRVVLSLRADPSSNVTTGPISRGNLTGNKSFDQSRVPKFSVSLPRLPTASIEHRTSQVSRRGSNADFGHKSDRSYHGVLINVETHVAEDAPLEAEHEIKVG